MKRVVLALLCLLIALPAQAAIYAQPTWDNLLKTVVRFGAMDMSNDKILDEYAMVTDCPLYKTFYQNDIKWKAVRDAERQSIDINLSHFPQNYVYQDKFKLGRYDFQQQIFHFGDDGTMQKVNAFFLLRAPGAACDSRMEYLPTAFRAILDQSVSLPGLPLTQRSADAMLRRMDANNNKDRTVYVRFNLHINYIGKLEEVPGAMSIRLRQPGADPEQPVIMNAQIDTIDFYEDENFGRLIYSYQP